jgi:hypothetical protein
LPCTGIAVHLLLQTRKFFILSSLPEPIALSMIVISLIYRMKSLSQRCDRRNMGARGL